MQPFTLASRAGGARDRGKGSEGTMSVGTKPEGTGRRAAASHGARRDRRARGLTLVELMVVVVIIAILIGAVVVASSTVINKARVTNTRALLTIVRDAVEEFRREQGGKPTITRDPAYFSRYGNFPPDELEVFTPGGIPAEINPMSHAPRGAEVFPAPQSGGVFGTMNFFPWDPTLEAAAMEFRDLTAMVLAIELFGDGSAAMLGHIQDRYRSSGPLAAGGAPALFLDRPDATGVPDGKWDSGDLGIRFIVDDWGVPLRYFSQRNFNPDAPAPPTTTNHPLWNQISTELVRANGGRPVIMSYGPNGKEQLAEDQMGGGGEARATVIADLEDDDKVNNSLNADNIYAEPSLKERLAEGIP